MKFRRIQPMKKVFALVLAVAMVMSLSAVAFAKGVEINDGVADVDTTARRYAADSNKMIPDVIQYGKAAYFAILDVEGNLITRHEIVDGLKVKVEYEMGKELVADAGVSVVKKYVENASTIVDGAEAGYYYFVEIKTVAKETTSDADIIATLELNKSKKGDDEGKNYKVKDLEIDIEVNVGYENSYYDWYTDSGVELYVYGDTVGDNTELEPETYYLLKYDYDDETEFTFGAFADQNEGTFTVDVSGQGKNLLYYDTKLDDGIADANPDAKIFALNFNNTKFNRTGEFMYEGEDFEYAYQLMADGSLKLLGEFDGEEITFKTRVLGSYLFSDVELVAAPAAVEEPSVEVPTVDVTNPATGAAC
ncbi:hypothetical protein [Yanshouia hominis]|uniref:Uncharacterized protein n=1 Tax=Yanshouia hominis TaxID=2763673 RepID=A0ABR7NF60_9FIRM|nr:hypothetical protein [Yanshouia hominis]MBC8575034.1 hypothetical protein [Yanshouia hominis]